MTRLLTDDTEDTTRDSTVGEEYGDDFEEYTSDQVPVQPPNIVSQRSVF